jgi:hypothetical protein
MTEDARTFYSSASAVSFVLLGLWWVVVQGRESWHGNLARRRMAYVISLHFVLPGSMSVLALAAPDESFVWRTSFTLAGGFGVASIALITQILREEHDTPRLVRLFQWIVLPLYVLVAVLAVAPEVVPAAGIPLTVLQVESVILTIILFFGVQSAWVLMTEPQLTASDDAAVGSESPATRHSERPSS